MSACFNKLQKERERDRDRSQALITINVDFAKRVIHMLVFVTAVLLGLVNQRN